MFLHHECQKDFKSGSLVFPSYNFPKAGQDVAICGIVDTFLMSLQDRCQYLALGSFS